MFRRLFGISPQKPMTLPNTLPYTLVMYSRTYGCPFISVARRTLNKYTLDYQEIMIDLDTEARERVLAWTGFLSVPTLVLADHGSLLPFAEVSPLEIGKSPRGINRGAMLTEPNENELTEWLIEHSMLVLS
jgi:glutaredoxin